MALTTRLFVGNLPENLNENALKDLFSSYGQITNFDLKSKPGVENDKKTFAFVTLSASNFDVETCIKHFTNEDFQGSRLYVTRARESFLERLQREREQNQLKDSRDIKHHNVPIIEKPVYKQLNSRIHETTQRKRKFSDSNNFDNDTSHTFMKKNKEAKNSKIKHSESSFNHDESKKITSIFQNDEKKLNSDMKRLESMKKKRQEFNQKKNIIKSGLISIDKQLNKKVKFSDSEDQPSENILNYNGKINDNNRETDKRKTNIFEDEGSDDEINFDIKKQYEGKKGQKVLDLQSRYKSDKRFVLDERFIEDESDTEKGQDATDDQEKVDLEQVDEKSKQLNILQNVLGVTIKTKPSEPLNKNKTKLGMLRFDPSQADHAKYLAPVEKSQEPVKKSKKKKKGSNEEEINQPPVPEVEKVEVSKEQFYKISDTLKEAITQPNSFSLRSLFSKDEHNNEEDPQAENAEYISLQQMSEKKVKNPLEPGERNPFKYDSSDSEDEEENNKKVKETKIPEQNETKTVWREKLFFSNDDYRLKEGLLFFSKTNHNEAHKERRELKSLMKKRIYNKERKNTMFQKKIGGRKKTMKKKFKK